MSWGKVCARAESMAQSQWWGREGGCRGRAVRELSILTAWRKKVSLSLLVLARRFCSLLPNSSRLERLQDGWVGSPALPVAFTGEAGVVNVQKEVKRDTADLLSCSHSAAESRGRKWCRCCTTQWCSWSGCLNGASVESVYNGGRGSQCTNKKSIESKFFKKRVNISVTRPFLKHSTSLFFLLSTLLYLRT